MVACLWDAKTTDCLAGTCASSASGSSWTRSQQSCYSMAKYCQQNVVMDDSCLRDPIFTLVVYLL
jgi:hypothetical protein